MQSLPYNILIGSTCRSAAYPVVTAALPNSEQISSSFHLPSLPVSAWHTPAPTPVQPQIPPLPTQPGLSNQYPFPSALSPPSLGHPGSLPAPSTILHHPAYVPASQSAVPVTDPSHPWSLHRLGFAGMSSQGQPLPGHLEKPWNVPMHSLPIFTADSYSLMTGSLPQCSTWPTSLSAPAVATSVPVPTATLPQLAVDPLELDPRQRVMNNACSDDESSVDSDPAALVEDALLGELFFAQLEASQVGKYTQGRFSTAVSHG